MMITAIEIFPFLGKCYQRKRREKSYKKRKNIQSGSLDAEILQMQIAEQHTDVLLLRSNYLFQQHLCPQVPSNIKVVSITVNWESVEKSQQKSQKTDIYLYQLNRSILYIWLHIRVSFISVFKCGYLKIINYMLYCILFS